MSENNDNVGNQPVAEEMKETTPVSKVVKSARGRGRPATVSDRAFIEVHAKSTSLDDIVGAFASLRSMEPKKARLYVSMRAATLRKKGNALKQFPRGRKSTKTPEVVANPTAPVME